MALATTPNLYAEPGLNSTALYYDAGRRDFACNDFRVYAEGDRVELFGKAYTVTWAGAAERPAPRFDAALLAKVAKPARRARAA